jgi:hypothetical protein
MSYSGEPILERLLKQSRSIRAQVDRLDREIDSLLARTAQLINKEPAESCELKRPASFMSLRKFE